MEQMPIITDFAYVAVLGSQKYQRFEGSANANTHDLIGGEAGKGYSLIKTFCQWSSLSEVVILGKHLLLQKR